MTKYCKHGHPYTENKNVFCVQCVNENLKSQLTELREAARQSLQYIEVLEATNKRLRKDIVKDFYYVVEGKGLNIPRVAIRVTIEKLLGVSWDDLKQPLRTTMESSPSVETEDKP